jgi:hypothetical protein
MWDSKCQVATWRAAARARAADGLQFEAVPAFEQQDLLVDPGQRAGGHEQVAQVRGGPPARQVVQRIVGQRDVPAGQAAQVLGRRGVVAEPVIAVAGLRWRMQRYAEVTSGNTNAASIMIGERRPR